MKKIKPHWQLQAMVDEIVRRLAPEHTIISVVQNDDDKIILDDTCRGIGRTEWCVGYIVPPSERLARRLIPTFKEEIDALRKRFDLGIACEY